MGMRFKGIQQWLEHSYIVSAMLLCTLVCLWAPDGSYRKEAIHTIKLQIQQIEAIHTIKLQVQQKT